MEQPLGDPPHSLDKPPTGNSRNGLTPKILKGSDGEVRIETRRDRDGLFEPPIIKKGQMRITGRDELLLCVSAKGLLTRDIVEAFAETDGAEVSAGLGARR